MVLTLIIFYALIVIRGISTMGEKSWNKKRPGAAQKYRADSKKGNSPTLTTGNVRDISDLSQRKMSWGLNYSSFWWLAHIPSTWWQAGALGEGSCEVCCKPQPGQRTAQDALNITSQEWGKSSHGSHAQLLHIVPNLSNQRVWRWISPEEALCCCENAQVYAQEPKCLEKLPNHCKRYFQD